MISTILFIMSLLIIIQTIAISILAVKLYSVIYDIDDIWNILLMYNISKVKSTNENRRCKNVSSDS